MFVDKWVWIKITQLTSWIPAHIFTLGQLKILCCVHSCHHHREILIFQFLGGGEIRLLHGVAMSTPRGVEGDKDLFVFDELTKIVVTELDNVWGLFCPCFLWFLLFGCFLFRWAARKGKILLRINGTLEITMFFIQTISLDSTHLFWWWTNT